METQTIKLSQNNFYQICRICYQQADLKDIFQSKYQDMKLSTILELFVPQKISENDGLPKNACLSCIKSLLNLNAFLDQYRLSSEALKSVYNYLFINTENLNRKKCIKINYTKIPNEDILLEKCSLIKLEHQIEADIKQITNKIVKSSENGSLKLSCPECNKLFKSRTILKTHYKNHTKNHPEQEFECAICNKTFTDKLKLLKHFNISHTTVKCPKCDLKLTQGSLRLHLKRHEPDFVPVRVKPKKRLCPICGASVPSSRMTGHMLRHDVPKPFRCQVCPFETAFASSLGRHQVKHKGNPLLCNACGKDFSRKEYFNRHMKLHDPFLNPQVCSICSETTVNPFDFRKHMIIHDAFRKKSCTPLYRQHCKVKKRNLIRTSEEGVKISKQARKCEECGKFCVNHSTYFNHMRYKHKIDKRLCTICGERIQGHMSVHMKSHNGKPLHKCDLCNNKVFNSESHLRRHNLLIHENKREHKCPYCGKGFNLPNSLQEHIRTHTGETLKCDYCEKTFKQNSTRYKHLREVHNVRLGQARTRLIQNRNEMSNDKKLERIGLKEECVFSNLDL